MAQTVIGLFDTFGQAESAVHELETMGMPENRISVVASNNNDEYTQYRDTHPATATGTGASTGAVVGGLGGILLGLGLLAIPGLGPLAAAGPLVAGLTGAGVGAATGGIIGALTDIGVPEEHAGYFAEGIRRGGTLVTVQADNNNVDRIIDILNRNGAVDINERAQYYQQTGYTGYNPNSQPYTREQILSERQRFAVPATSTTVNRDVNTTVNPLPAQNVNVNRDVNQGETVLPVVEEELQVGKRQVERGGVRVYTHVSERPVEERVSLHEEHVNVDRRPVNRPINNADMAAFKEGSFDVTETAEELVVNKQARVVEEVVINKQAMDRTETVRDTVRRTDVDVEQIPGSEHVSRSGASYDTYANDFRTDWQTNYSRQGGTFEQYAPAYRYGSDLYNNASYRGRNWSEIEPEIQRDWNTRYPNTWDQMKNSIRYGWDKMTGAERGGIQTGGHALDGSPDTRGIMEKTADAVTGDRIDDKTGNIVR